MLEFDDEAQGPGRPVIKVVGVGGGGGNALNTMIEAGVEGVDFIVANTDCQVIRRPRRIPTLRTSTWRSWGPPSPSPPPTCPALRPSAFRIPPTGCPRGARTPSHWTPPDR